MTALERESERYAATGSIAAEGVNRLLGAPHFDPLQLAVRETVQNSWDARLEDRCPEYRMRVRTLTREQHDSLASRVLTGLGDTSAWADSLKTSLAKPALRVLEISDFNTAGLGGPTQPDEPPRKGESTDFVDFMRNIGSPRDTPQGGGTYGYGKSSLYRLSDCSAVVVYSVTRFRGRPAHRFMAAHVGRRFDLKTKTSLEPGRYTGRHWWGVRRERLEPAEGRLASQLAKALGLEERSDDDTGTSILVLDPDLSNNDSGEEDRASRSVEHRLLEALLWNFWPKMLVRPSASAPTMRFGLTIEDEVIQIPSPEQCPPLDLFAQAMRRVWSEDPSDSTEIRSQRPAKLLGRFATWPGSLAGRPRPDLFAPHQSRLIPTPCRHVALMRPAELVVKYIEGPPPPDEDIEWAGVFRVSDEEEVESAFAQSEPPAHDDWEPSFLPSRSREKRLVNVGLRELRKVIQRLWEIDPGCSTGDDGQNSLGLIGDRLGSMLTGMEGQSPGKQSGSSSGSTSSRRRLGRPRFVRLQDHSDKIVAVFEIPFRGELEGLRAEARPIVVGDGIRSEFSASGQRPRVLRWLLGDQEISSAQRVEFSGPSSKGKLELEVQIPPDAAVEVSISEEDDAQL